MHSAQQHLCIDFTPNTIAFIIEVMKLHLGTCSPARRMCLHPSERLGGCKRGPQVMRLRLVLSGVYDGAVLSLGPR